MAIFTDSEYCYNIFAKYWYRIWRRNRDQDGDWYKSNGSPVMNQSVIEEILDAKKAYGGEVLFIDMV